MNVRLLIFIVLTAFSLACMEPFEEFEQLNGAMEEEFAAFLQEIDVSNHIKCSCLHEAAQANDCNRIRMLLAKGVEVDSYNDDGMTALQVAVNKHAFDAIRCLIVEGNASSNIKSTAGYFCAWDLAKFHDDISFEKKQPFRKLQTQIGISLGERMDKRRQEYEAQQKNLQEKLAKK